MRNMKKLKILVLSLAVIGMVVVSFYVPADAQKGREGIDRELQKDIGMPVLDGNLWQKMTDDSKIAFVWGMWHTIAVSNYMVKKYPELKKEDFSAKAEEAAGKIPLTMNQTVAIIDSYYRNNPDQLGKPVVGVLWATVIKPNITTGIAGRPLNPSH